MRLTKHVAAKNAEKGHTKGLLTPCRDVKITKPTSPGTA